MIPKLDAYVERLRAVPFVRAVSIDEAPVQVGKHRLDALLLIQTPTGQEKLFIEVKSSNMSREMAAQVATLVRDVQPLIVAAPVIGSGIGDFLAENNTSFVDLRGNCHLDLGGRYVARIQGRSGDQPTTARALRTPSYQVLFTVLAEPKLISAPVRTLAAAAGVSRQPVLTLRERLVELGLVVRGAKGHLWTPHGPGKALDLWLAGFATSVRQGLLVGRYRTQDADPDALEQRVAPILDKVGSWRWGGGAASHRMTGYFRGERTVVHVEDPPADLQRRLRGVPAPDGPLIVLRSPGPKGLEGTLPDTAHPLLVYTELLTDGSERARDAAQELADRYAIGRVSRPRCTGRARWRHPSRTRSVPARPCLGFGFVSQEEARVDRCRGRTG